MVATLTLASYMQGQAKNQTENSVKIICLMDVMV